MIASSNGNGRSQTQRLPPQVGSSEMMPDDTTDWKAAIQGKAADWIRSNPGGAMIAALVIGGALGWLVKRNR